jgi:O-antigen ligase
MGSLNPAGKTHNEYLQILLDHGAIVFVIAMYLLVRTLQKCREKANTPDKELAGLYQALFVSFVGFLFGFISVSLLSYHGNNFLQMFFFLNVGLAYASIETPPTPASDTRPENEGNERTIERQPRTQNG